MIDITKETLENNDIEVIVAGANPLWLNEKDIEEQLGHKNLPAITNKYDKIYKKHRYELVDEPIKQPNRRFLRIDLALKITMDCRTDESSSLKRNLGFNLQDVINTKEQTVLKSLKKHLKEKICKLNTPLWATGLIFIFININLQLKLMN